VDRERTDLTASPVARASAATLAAPQLPGRTAVRGWLRSVELRVVLALLLLALLRGLVYVVVVPPWVHYDEPTHFEYAALINLLGRRPAIEETDRNLRFAIARSVHIYTPWRIARMPIDTGDNPLPDIGIGQVAHPPLYYMLASLALRLTANAPIEVQLYSMRAFSLLLYLLGLMLAAVVVWLALPRAAELRLATLATLIRVPPYTRLMSAASNDGLVALVGIVLLLIAIAIVQQGWSWRSLVLLLVGFVLPFVTKRTTFVLSLVPLLAGLLVAPRLVRRWIITGTAVVLLAGLGWLVSLPRGSSYWINPTTGRMAQPSVLGAHSGREALLLSAANPNDVAGVGQLLSPLGVFKLSREELTVGVWARALDGEVQVVVPSVVGARGSEQQTVTLSTQWQFIKHKVRMPRSPFQVELRLNPPLGLGAVLYDDAVAVQGDYSKVAAPPTVGADGLMRWGDEEGPTLLRNGSAEQLMPLIQLPAGVESVVQKTLPFGTIDLLASSLGDWNFIAAAYPSGALFLFKTFWLIIDSGFSAAAIDRWTLTLLLLAGGALVGWGRLATRRLQSKEERPTDSGNETASQSQLVLALCWAAASLAWGIALVRVHLQPPWPAADYTYPIGRYVYAAFVPTVVLLVAGLGAFVPQRWRLWLSVGVIALFFTYDLQVLGTTIWYYYVAQ